jgi:tripartite ATP-independent transporter DctM subunit
MDWWLVLTIFIGGLLLLLLSGMPIVFAFLLMDMLGIIALTGFAGIKQIPLHIFSGLSTFVLVPIPLFIFMGELMFHSGIAFETINVLDKWLARLPGRLSLLAAVSGTIFAATSGSTLANTAMLGTVLMPEMRKRGYDTSMAIGPIIGVGGLAMLIPPSALAVVLASIGRISVSKILLGSTIPGLLLGGMFMLYIIIRCAWNPALAPRFEIEAVSLRRKLVDTFKYVVPMGFIIFMVLGLIILGAATPSEAAASGCVATFVVVLLYGRFSRQMMVKAVSGTLNVSVMVLMIIATSKTFSSVLAFSGATNGLLSLVEQMALPPLVVLISMQLVVFFMGTFMESVAIMMICMPIFMPICKILGFDPVWFGVLMLINIEMGLLTPPFGMLLFVMKGVVPEEIGIEKIVWAAVPYVVFDVVIMALIVIFPQIVLWLASKSG